MEKNVLNRVLSKTHGGQLSLPVAFIPKPGTARARFASLKNKKRLAELSQLPRFTPAYRLLFRR